MTGAIEKKPVWRNEGQVVRTVACDAGCGATASLGIEGFLTIAGVEDAALRGFVVLGWARCRAQWFCPVCWAALVAVRGGDEAVKAAMIARHHLARVEVVA